MKAPKRPVQPVLPSGMDLVFIYRCPNCGHRATVYAPTTPTMAMCDACEIPFPLVPVDERTIHFIKIMLANGRAAVDSDFV